MMDIFDIIKRYDEDNLYNIRTVIKEFSTYFELSIEEMLELFQKYVIISSESIYNYLKEINIDNLNIIFTNRVKDYHYYKETLEILSNKALMLLDLINYLAVSNGNTNVNEYEKRLKELQIYHYSSIVKGKDINRILIVLFHIIKKFNQTLENVNDIYKYSNQRINIYDVSTDVYYPSKTLISEPFKLDKTSFYLKRKVK